MAGRIKGSIIVPERHDREQSRTLTLPYLRDLGHGRGLGEPIYYLNGGPGVSNFSTPLPSRLLDRHEIVRLEYRGVGKASTVLTASRVGRVLRGVRHELSLEEGRRLAPALADAVQPLARRADLEGYTIEAVVEDLEHLRRRLGHGRINLLGHSFGTRVALAYMQRYPEHCARAVLAAPNPPGRFMWHPEETNRLLRGYAALYRRAYPERGDLFDMMCEVSAKMPRRWMGMRIDRAKVLWMAHMSLFNPFGAKYVFDCFQAAWNGEAGGLAFFSQSYDRLLPHLFTWGAFFAMGISADYDAARLTEIDRAGRDAPLDAAAALLFGCAAETPWAKIAPGPRPAYQSNVPALLLCGELDGSTPPSYAADDLLPGMPHARQVVLKGMGHVGPMYNQPRATAHLVGRFLEDGSVHPECYYTGTPDLHTNGLGVSLVAKTGLGFAALAAASAVFRFRSA